MQKHNPDLTVHALNRVLSHLSESNYPAMQPHAAKEMEMAQYHGRATARVIVKRLLREAEWSARMVGGLSWQIAKDASQASCVRTMVAIAYGVTDYRTPYDVFQSIHGEYNPDVVPVVPFSVWMSAEKSAYLAEHPEAARNQIDGHFYDPELERFFRWISARPR